MTKNKFYIVIPARLNSSRLPKKALIDINGKTMLERTWKQASLSDAQDIIIATDSHKIMQEARSFGAKVCMTSIKHESGTSRVQEACCLYNFGSQNIIVNVQADEPMVNPNDINSVVESIATKATDVATLKTKIIDPAEYTDHNQVKLVTDKQGYALYFSRAPIPWNKANNNYTNSQAMDLKDVFKHIGIYAYRVETLNKFISLPKTTLEQIEGLEQLRLLVNGYKIYATLCDYHVSIGVDTFDDLAKVRELTASTN